MSLAKCMWVGGGNSFAYGVPSGGTPPPDVRGSLLIEAEDFDNTVDFAPFAIQNSADASGGKFIVVPKGSGSVFSAPSTGHAKYEFTLPNDASVGIWLRVLARNTESDSFFLDVTGDDMGPANWGTGTSSTWTWRKWKQVSLPAGNHVLTVARREDGTQLDSIYISVDGSKP